MAQPAAVRPLTGAEPYADEVHLFARGVARGLAGPVHARTLQTLLAALTPGQLLSVRRLLQPVPHEGGRVLVLKALAAGEPWAHLQAYAREIAAVGEGEAIARSTFTDDPDLVQQWNDSCGPTVAQALAGDHDPRYAWELSKSDVSRVDPTGAGRDAAEQQREWLERYGGRAVPRGASGGRGIPISQMLDEQVGPMIGVSYACQFRPDLDPFLDAVARSTAEGYGVPLCVSWGAGSGPEGATNHFVVALRVRGDRGRRGLLVHDPWTGRTAWVGEGDLARDRLPPFTTGYARITHVYTPVPLGPGGRPVASRSGRPDPVGS